MDNETEEEKKEQEPYLNRNMNQDNGSLAIGMEDFYDLLMEQQEQM